MDDKALAKVLGQVVREKRTKLGFSQEAFADEVGVHRTYQGLIENGRRNVTVVTLFKLAAAFGTQPSQLLREVEKRLGS